LGIYSRTLKVISYVIFSGVFLFAPLYVGAQSNENANQNPFSYRVRQGDTLNNISERFLLKQEMLTELLRANGGISQNELQVGQIILIPRPLVRYYTSQAVVAFLKCTAPITLGGSTKPLKVGSAIIQGDIINVPTQCDVSLQFEDRSLVRMPSGGSIKISVLRKCAFEKSPEVQLNLLDGRVEVKVPRRQSGDAPFGVSTPTSVAGVRGTEFRVGFDQSSGVGKVEVSSGLVGTRGVADSQEAGVSAQKGVVIPGAGLAGKVEDLPAPVKFLSAQAQQLLGWYLFVFQGSLNSRSYYLKESQTVNGVNEASPIRKKEPLFLSAQLGVAAKMLTWSAETASGLMGDESVFGVCVDQSGGADKKRCSVSFDLTALREPNITLIESSPTGQDIEILKAYKPVRELKALLVKGLPVGKYRWEIQSQIGNNLTTRQEGRFELVAATPN
jgi:hypothetical protein